MNKIKNCFSILTTIFFQPILMCLDLARLHNMYTILLNAFFVHRSDMQDEKPYTTPMKNPAPMAAHVRMLVGLDLNICPLPDHQCSQVTLSGGAILRNFPAPG